MDASQLWLKYWGSLGFDHALNIILRLDLVEIIEALRGRHLLKMHIWLSLYRAIWDFFLAFYSSIKANKLFIFFQFLFTIVLDVEASAKKLGEAPEPIVVA